MVDLQQTIKVLVLSEHLKLIKVMLYSALEEIPPLEDDFQISKANFIPQVDGVNFASHAFAKHP